MWRCGPAGGEGGCPGSRRVRLHLLAQPAAVGRRRRCALVVAWVRVRRRQQAAAAAAAGGGGRGSGGGGGWRRRRGHGPGTGRGRDIPGCPGPGRAGPGRCSNLEGRDRQQGAAGGDGPQWCGELCPGGPRQARAGAAAGGFQLREGAPARPRRAGAALLPPIPTEILGSGPAPPRPDWAAARPGPRAAPGVRAIRARRRGRFRVRSRGVKRGGRNTGGRPARATIPGWAGQGLPARDPSALKDDAQLSSIGCRSGRAFAGARGEC